MGDLTPRELGMAVDAYVDREEHLTDRDIRLAHLIASLMRVKPRSFPDVDKLLEGYGPGEPRQLTEEERRQQWEELEKLKHVGEEE